MASDNGYVGLMQPGPTIAEAERRAKEARESGYLGLMSALAEPLTYSPHPGINAVATIAQNIGDQGWAKGLASGLGNIVMNSIVRTGPGKLHMYERAGPKVNPLDPLSTAVRRYYERTGIFHDLTGNPLKEFSDDAAKPKDALVNVIDDMLRRRDWKYYKTYRSGELFDHPELFMRHPELADLPVTIGYMNDINRYGGSYVPGRMQMFVPGGGTNESPLRVWLHENQHAIQNKQGLPRGANDQEIERQLAAAVTHFGGPEDTLNLADKIRFEAKNRYLLTEGELGARMVERRQPLTSWERRQSFPLDDQLAKGGRLIPREKRVLEPYDPQAIDIIARRLLGIPEAP